MMTLFLLVKDFYATTYSVSNEFMTNADVPTLALDGLLESPVNPFTGNPITNNAKSKGNLLITTAEEFDQHPENTLDMGNNVWYTITGDNLFIKENWEKVQK